MKSETHYVQGELYLSLETFADAYQIRLVWLREAYDQGLLGDGVPRGETICIAALQMERVATIIRLHHSLGLPLESIRETLEKHSDLAGDRAP